MIKPRFITLSYPFDKLFRRLGIAALTMPWGHIYIHPDGVNLPKLRRHELVHIAQIRRDGALRFTLTYLYWLVIKREYWYMPYEIEARRISGW